MDALAERIGRARLGPIPLPYIFIIALLPFYTLFSSHENSMLFSMCVIITVTIKGSLLSCWILSRTVSWTLQMTLVSCVMTTQVIILQTCLQSSLLSLIVLIPPSTFTGICIFTFHLWDRRGDKHEDPFPGPWCRQLIGIFSRSAPEEYAWLASMLKKVGKVVSFPITNSNSHQFEQQVSQCTFAILYHSKTRGRVNITNVTDSLYDHELEHMSSVLGKSNVIVVADDMDDSSPKTGNSILMKQTSIAQLSRGLYLFTAKEKMDDQVMKDKVQPLYDIISKGSTSDVVCNVVSVFLAVAPWFYFIYSIYHVFFLITTNLSGSFLMYYSTYSPNNRDSVLPSTYPIQRQRNPPRSRGKKKTSHVVGLIAVLVLMVVELSSLYWVASHINMVLLIAQSLGTGAFTFKMSMS